MIKKKQIKDEKNIFAIGIELLNNSKSNKQYERKYILKLPHIKDNDFGFKNKAVLIIGNDLINNIFYIIDELGLFSQYIHHKCVLDVIYGKGNDYVIKDGKMLLK